MSASQSSTVLGPQSQYQHEVDSGLITFDPAQARAVEELQRIFDAFTETPAPKQSKGFGGWLGGLLGRTDAPELVTGLYLWGGVGRGKTHLVNALHDALPFEKKMRVHFHRFMQSVHRRLKHLSDKTDPLLLVADELADETRILCFDEFHVSDIADAMILGKLLDALFERGVCLVATSNTEPKNLYKGGLQRQQVAEISEIADRQHAHFGINFCFEFVVYKFWINFTVYVVFSLPQH